MRKRSNVWKYGMLSCGVMLWAAGLLGCGSVEETTQGVVTERIEVSSANPLVEEQFSTVVYGDVVKQELYSGVVTPYVEELFFAEDGTFLEYCVTLGDAVEAGQVLAKTDTQTTENAVEQLEEKIAGLKNNYEYRGATIRNNIAILEEEMAINYEALESLEYMSSGYTQTCQALGYQDKSKKSYELELKQLTEVYELELPYYEKKLKEAKAMLDSNVIVAPFDGVVVQLRSISGGEGVSSEVPYVAVADTGRQLALGAYVGNSVIAKAEKVYVFADGKEYEAEYIPMDGKVYSEMQAKGKVAQSSYEIKNGEELAYGQSVVIVVQKESRENVLVVPFIGVKQEASSHYCYVKRGDKREKVFIEVGLFDGMNYEVLSGLAEGDEVVIE